MSYQEYTYYGYGFELVNATNLDLVKQIVIDAYEDDEVNKFVANYESTDVICVYDFIRDFETQFCCDESVSMTISNWMNSNDEINPKHIWFTGYADQSEFDTYEAVLFQECYPWQMSEEEKNLTQEELDEILKKFANLLGVPENDITYLTMRYGG